MRLVHDDREALAGCRDSNALSVGLHRAYGLGNEGELLNGGDDDWHPISQRLRQLLGVFVNLLHHPQLVLELENGVLQLLVKHTPIRDHHHRMKNLLVVVVVQTG
ncbi:hypothetical protein D3C77_452540 [compost metagenome]